MLDKIKFRLKKIFNKSDDKEIDKALAEIGTLKKKFKDEINKLERNS